MSSKFFNAAKCGRLQEKFDQLSKFTPELHWALKNSLATACEQYILDLVKHFAKTEHADVILSHVFERTLLIAVCENNSSELVRYLVKTCLLMLTYLMLSG